MHVNTQMIKFLFLCISLCDLLEMISSFKNSTSTCFKHEKSVTQSCPTFCDPVDYTVHGILQSRILEWVADRKSVV